MAARFWTCQRQANGVKCGAKNSARRQLCVGCGRRRPQIKRPAHMAVLSEMTYEEAVALWGERCGICGAKPGTRRLHRDHEHKGSGHIRGLLCFRCNAALRTYLTVEWLEKAAAYLRRAESHREAA
mgnify:CR=1 FL=1